MERGQGDFNKCKAFVEAKFDPGNDLSRLEEIEKTLNALKEHMTETSVRCHLLKLDLATNYCPETMLKMQEAVKECTKCINSVASQASLVEMDTDKSEV